MATEIMAFEYFTDTTKAAHLTSMVKLAELYDAGWEILTPPYTVHVEPGQERVIRAQVLLIREDKEK